MINKDMTHDEMDREIKKSLLGKGYDALEADMEFNNITTNSKAPASGKVAIYARHSSNEEMLDKQVEELVKVAAAIGDDECVIYKEVAEPYAETYEQQEELMRELKTKGITRVYVKSRDRFCKDPIRSLEFAHKLVDAGIEITETKTLGKESNI